MNDQFHMLQNMSEFISLIFAQLWFYSFQNYYIWIFSSISNTFLNYYSNGEHNWFKYIVQGSFKSITPIFDSDIKLASFSFIQVFDKSELSK